MLVMVPTFVMTFSITLNARITPRMHHTKVGMNASGIRYKPRQLRLNIHTHWKVGNCMGKCVKCLDALHRCTCHAVRIEPCSYTALCALIQLFLIQLASYSVAMPSLILSTQTDSCCSKSKISHERIALKLTAEAVVFLLRVEPCDNVHKMAIQPQYHLEL